MSSVVDSNQSENDLAPTFRRLRDYIVPCEIVHAIPPAPKSPTRHHRSPHVTTLSAELAQDAEKNLLPEQDSELKYYQGAILAACGERQIAYEFLRKAVAENYCARQALESDPMLAAVRGDPTFRQIVQAAAECQQKFAAAQEMGR